MLREIYRAKVKAFDNTVPLTDQDVEDTSDWGQDPLLILLEAEHAQEATRMREELRAAIRDLVQELPSDQQDVLTARNDLELSPKDAAALLGWKVEKVSSDYYRARKRLREGLLRKYGRDRVAGWRGKCPAD